MPIKPNQSESRLIKVRSFLIAHFRSFCPLLRAFAPIISVPCDQIRLILTSNLNRRPCVDAALPHLTASNRAQSRSVALKKGGSRHHSESQAVVSPLCISRPPTLFHRVNWLTKPERVVLSIVLGLLL